MAYSVSRTTVLFTWFLVMVTLADTAAGGKLHEGGFGFDKLVLVHRYPVESSHPYTFFYMDYRRGGGLYVYDLKAKSLNRIVDSSDGQILNADLDFDGRRVVFAWRRGKGYRNDDKGFKPGRNAFVHIWTVNTDGSDLRQLTIGKHFNYDPCWLSDGGIAFVSARENRWVYCNSGPVGVLHRMADDGSNIVRLSANVLNDFTPSMTTDGRILYTRWEYVDKSPLAIQSLWTIHPDGTGLAVVYGNRVLSPATFIEARQIPGTQKLLCTMTGHVKPIRGAIGLIDPARGVNEQIALTNLTPEVDVPPVDFPDGDLFRGPYNSPYPLDDEFYLTSKDGTLLLCDYEGTPHEVVIKRRGEMGFYSPRPLRARPRPPVMPSTVPPSQKARRWAAVYVQDVYKGLEPHVKRGEIKRICVVEEMPRDAQRKRVRCRFSVMNLTVSCGSTYATRKVWGFADVAEDGSAYFKVPAEKAIFFLALDDQGRAVQRMRSYTHLMPGEVQGCVGCHASRSYLSPLGRAKEFVRRPPQELGAPEWWTEAGFAYERIVQPVLDKNCIECHSGAEAPKTVRLTGERTRFFSTSYDTLAMGTKMAPPHRYRGQNGLIDNPYTDWISGFHGCEDNILEVEPRRFGSPRSKLADIILAGHPAKDGRPRVNLSRAEKQRILTWIDVNVPFYGSFTEASEDMDKTAHLRAQSPPSR